MIGIRNMARNKNIMSKALFKKIDAQNSAQMKSPIKKTQKEYKSLNDLKYSRSEQMVNSKPKGKNIVNNKVASIKPKYKLTKYSKEYSPSSNLKSSRPRRNTTGPPDYRERRSKSVNDIIQISNLLTTSRSRRDDDYDSEIKRARLELYDKRSKLYSCIYMFNILQVNNMPLRCIQHNNVLTLYCLTERRVLCVNCIYGVTQHRTHKILPLINCLYEIYEDNYSLRTILETDMRDLYSNIKGNQKNAMLLDRELKNVLADLYFTYKKKFEELRVEFEVRKEKATNLFQSLIDKTTKLQGDIYDFKFKISESLLKLGIGKPVNASSDTNVDVGVIRQSFAVNLVELTRLYPNKLTEKQLQRLVKTVNEHYEPLRKELDEKTPKWKR